MIEQSEFELALQHKERGEYAKALRILVSLKERRPDSAALVAVMGQIYCETGQYSESIEAFHEAINLAPRSETPSLGLFHCLWECGRKDAAFDEMRRFVSLEESAEYRRIVDEINAAENEDTIDVRNTKGLGGRF